MAGTDVGRLTQLAAKGRTVAVVAAADVVLFVIANVTYGNSSDKHPGMLRTVSNVVWTVFLIGFVVLVLCGILTLARVVRRRSTRQL